MVMIFAYSYLLQVNISSRPNLIIIYDMKIIKNVPGLPFLVPYATLYDITAMSHKFRIEILLNFTTRYAIILYILYS